jgi:aflatoxin B1 aldehyde reductase
MMHWPIELLCGRAAAAAAAARALAYRAISLGAPPPRRRRRRRRRRVRARARARLLSIYLIWRAGPRYRGYLHAAVSKYAGCGRHWRQLSRQLRHAMRTFGRGVHLIASYRQSDSDPLPPKELGAAFRQLLDADCLEYDTARSYGREPNIGAALASLPLALASQLQVSTKVSPLKTFVANDGTAQTGGFSREGILAQAATSRAELRRDSVKILYLHSPCTETDIDECLGAINELWLAGFFAEFGVSNFEAWQVMQIYYKCKERGYALPTVYQGVYNPLRRNVEEHILPCCRMLGMRFNAFSPFSAGILQQPWPDDGSTIKLRGPERGRYYGSKLGAAGSNTWSGTRTEKSLIAVVNSLDKACRSENISLAQATARWHWYHSALTIGDGIIIGAASLVQLAENLTLADVADAAGPLPQSVLVAFNGVWDSMVAMGPFPYPARSHMPAAKI